MTEQVAPWERVFLPAVTGVPEKSFRMKLLRKATEPFLLLPEKPRLRAAAMSLYAPQTKKARWMKRIFRTVSRLGINPGLENVTVTLRSDDPFLGYLGEVAQTEHPQFAILAGNPKAPGQRCMFLVFDSRSNPAAVIKASGTADGQRLIWQETNFLERAPRHLPGLPKLRSVFKDERVSAFAMDFYDGTSPGSNEHASVHKLLSAWAEPARVTAVAETTIWKRLLSEAGPKISPTARELGGMRLCTVTHHGDFAPWNIRANHGNWMVLDWERGDCEGLPLWDWLHFVVQPAILVRGVDAVEALAEVSELLVNPLFLHYAEMTKIRGMESELVCAYLDYCVHVTKQTEGRETIIQLAQLFGNLSFLS